MALIATNENNPVELRARMFVELAQYVAPKRKAVEHSGDGAMLEALLLKLDAEHVDGAATRWLPADLGFKLFGISLKIAGRLIAIKNCGVACAGRLLVRHWRCTARQWSAAAGR
jgi:hypothetical protein